MFCRWEMHLEPFTLNPISLSLLKKATILPYLDLRSSWYYANVDDHHRVEIESNLYIMTLCWCILILLSIISDLSPGSGHHLPRAPAAASILQAQGLGTQEPLRDGEISEMWRQRYSLLVRNKRLNILVTRLEACSASVKWWSLFLTDLYCLLVTFPSVLGHWPA